MICLPIDLWKKDRPIPQDIPDNTNTAICGIHFQQFKWKYQTSR